MSVKRGDGDDSEGELLGTVADVGADPVISELRLMQHTQKDGKRVFVFLLGSMDKVELENIHRDLQREVGDKVDQQTAVLRPENTHFFDGLFFDLV